MFNSQNGAQQWETILKENLNVTNEEKLNWVSQYAAIHEIHESQVGVNNMQTLPQANVNGVGPVYTTPLNTLGIGNVTAPSQLDPMSTAP